MFSHSCVPSNRAFSGSSIRNDNYYDSLRFFLRPVQDKLNWEVIEEIFHEVLLNNERLKTPLNQNVLKAGFINCVILQIPSVGSFLEPKHLIPRVVLKSASNRDYQFLDMSAKRNFFLAAEELRKKLYKNPKDEFEFFRIASYESEISEELNKAWNLCIYQCEVYNKAKRKITSENSPGQQLRQAIPNHNPQPSNENARTTKTWFNILTSKVVDCVAFFFRTLCQYILSFQIFTQIRDYCISALFQEINFSDSTQLHQKI